MTTDELRLEVERQAPAISDSIVADWKRVAVTEVWHALPPQMTHDDLPNVLKAITSAALDDRFRVDAVHEILRYSAEHGLHRNQEGFQEGFLYTEYHLLRRSLWDFIRNSLAGDDAVRVITRIDAAISLATMAGLRGFHQQTFVERGDWPDALFRLITDWPLAGQ
jgi:hypothetical protein